MDGQVSSKLNYEDWLKTKTPAFQLDVLGPTKFRLWQAGQLSLRNMIDQSHNPMTVDALVAKTGVPKVTIDSALQTAKTAQPAAAAKATAATQAADDAFKASLKADEGAAADAAKAAAKASDEALAAKEAQAKAEAALAQQKEIEASKTEFKNLLVAGKKVPKELDKKLLALPEDEYDALLDEVSAAKKAAKEIADAKVAYTKAKLAGEAVPEDALTKITALSADELKELADDVLAQKQAIEAAALKVDNAKKVYLRSQLSGDPIPAAFVDDVAKLNAGVLTELNAEAQAIKAAQAATAEAAEQAAAKVKLNEIIAQKATFEKRAYLKLQKQGIDFDDLPPKSALEIIDAQVKVDKAAKKISDGVSNYKKAVLAGKNPPPAAVKVFNDLDDAAQQKVIDDIAKKQAALAPAAPKSIDEIVAEYKAGNLSDVAFIEQYHIANGTFTDTVKEGIALVKKAGPKNTVAKDLAKILVDDADSKLGKVTTTAAPTPPQKVGTMTVSKIQDDAQEFIEKFRFGEYDEKQAIAAAGKILGDSADDIATMQGFTGTTLDNTVDHMVNNVKNVVKDIEAAKYHIKQRGLKVADEVVEAVPEIKPAAVVTKPTGAPVVDDLTRIGEQSGSNPGGLYQDATTGQKWYVKTPATEEIARNEVLAAKFYEKMGIDVPELHVVQMNGRPSIASKIVDGLSENSTALRAGEVAGVHEGFVADAFLANWDVVGLGYDNLLVKAGKAIRVDTGGALRYRAQGTLKGNAFGRVVDEIDSLRNPANNRQSASVFGRITDEELKAGARKVAALTDDDIALLIREHGPLDVAEQAQLIDQMIARRDDIKRRFKIRGRKPKAAKRPDDFGKPVTKFEHDQIEDARSNGFALLRDKDMIEDQQILAWNEATKDGTRPMLQLKLRGEITDALEDEIAKNAAPGVNRTRVIYFTELDDLIKKSVIGLKHRLEVSDGLYDTTIRTRIEDALKEHKRVRKQIARYVDDGRLPQSRLTQFDDNYDQWKDALEKSMYKYSLNEEITALHSKFPKENFKDGVLDQIEIKPKVVKLDPGTRQWKRVEFDFEEKKLDKGVAKVTGKKINPIRGRGAFHEADIDGVTVRYYADDGTKEYFALRNRVEVVMQPGQTHEQGLATLKKLGINVERATDVDAEELYLRQIMSHITEGGNTDHIARFNTFTSQLAAVADDTARLQKARLLVSEALGEDVTKMAEYNFNGSRQAFGHGYRHLNRPDMNGADWNKFFDEHRLHHSATGGRGLPDTIDAVLNSGGNFIATTDKLRRGVALDGMSPDSDLRTGGASYFFTRIKSVRSARGESGITWKSQQLKRLDSISYNHDAYGEVKTPFVLDNRKTGIKGYENAMSRSSNETIFKNSLSLFDDLDVIVARSSRERQQVLDVIRKHGITRWPDGRSIEDVVTVAGQ